MQAQLDRYAAPRLVFWELTTGCNLKCIHCRANAQQLMSPDDLPTSECLRILDEIAAEAGANTPSRGPTILVLSGGEPLWRTDVFDIARHARSVGLRVALATNGTLIDEDRAARIKESGIERVAISLDGPTPLVHDRFRGQPGAFFAAISGLRHAQRAGLSTQINTTVSKHNSRDLPRMLNLALSLGVDAFHLFLLVPVGCGLTIAESDSVRADEAEKILNWYYDQSLTSGLELKATCAPQYYRIARQRRAADRRAGLSVPELNGHAHADGNGHANGHGHPQGLNAMTKGCLAGTGVCFISHQGEIFPCGYLPLPAGDLRQQSFHEVWQNSSLFATLRDVDQLQGKCGVCEFKRVCSGCRARAHGWSGEFLAEEPFCVHQPKSGPQLVSL